MIQVLHRAFDILDKVASATQPVALGKLAIDLNLKPGTCANIVKTLVERGFLNKAGDNKGYVLGPKLLQLAGPSGVKRQLNEVSEDVLMGLTGSLNENCLIAILFHGKRLIVHHQISKHQIQAITSDQKNAYDSSTGRLLLAYLTDNERELFISQYGLPEKQTWPEMESKRQLMHLLDDIKAQGYIFIEDSVQVVGFAAPVFQNGRVVAALSVYVPAFRFNSSLRQQMLEKGLEAAKLISHRLL